MTPKNRQGQLRKCHCQSIQLPHCTLIGLKLRSDKKKQNKLIGYIMPILQAFAQFGVGKRSSTDLTD